LVRISPSVDSANRTRRQHTQSRPLHNDTHPIHSSEKCQWNLTPSLSGLFFALHLHLDSLKKKFVLLMEGDEPDRHFDGKDFNRIASHRIGGPCHLRVSLVKRVTCPTGDDLFPFPMASCHASYLLELVPEQMFVQCLSPSLAQVRKENSLFANWRFRFTPCYKLVAWEFTRSSPSLFPPWSPLLQYGLRLAVPWR
jgi:hypothetical protein